MKTKLKHLLQWVLLNILFLILWIAGMTIGNLIFPSDLMQAPENDSEGYNLLMGFVVSALNTAVILYFINNARIRAWKLTGTIALFMFGIQYFMSQIETLWFNDSLRLPLNGILAIVTGGAISSLLFALAATWVTGNLNIPEESPEAITIEWNQVLKKTVWLAVVIWPAIYFLAGYLIAWQFEAVRLFYSGTTEMDSFLSLMKENFLSGLYFFQIFRGIIWVLIALLIMYATTGSWLRKGIILGLLLSILGSSGLLLPNPFMIEEVRLAHLLETSTSNFLWGMILAWFFYGTQITQIKRIRTVFYP